MVEDSNMYNYHIRYTNPDTNKLIGFSKFIRDISIEKSKKNRNLDTNEEFHFRNSGYKNFVCGFEGKSFYVDEKVTPGQMDKNDHLHINIKNYIAPKNMRNKIQRSKEYYAKKCYSCEEVRTTETINIGYCAKMNTGYKFTADNLEKPLANVHNRSITVDDVEAWAKLQLALYIIRHKYAKSDRKQKILIEIYPKKPTSCSQILDYVLEIYERDNLNFGCMKTIESLVIHLALKLNIITMKDFKYRIMEGIKYQVFEKKI